MFILISIIIVFCEKSHCYTLKLSLHTGFANSVGTVVFTVLHWPCEFAFEGMGKDVSMSLY